MSVEIDDRLVDAILELEAAQSRQRALAEHMAAANEAVISATGAVRFGLRALDAPEDETLGSLIESEWRGLGAKLKDARRQRNEEVE